MSKLSLMVFNPQMELMAKIGNKGVCVGMIEAIQTESIEPKDYIELSVLENSSNSDLFTVGNYTGYIDDHGILNMYIIQTLEERNAMTKHIVCEGMYIELCYELGVERNFASATIKDILKELLKDSTWEIGDVELEERHEFTITVTDKLSLLRRLSRLFECDLYFTYAIENNKIIKRVNITKSRGKNTGKRFEYGKDIKEIIRTVDLSEVRTAIVGTGKSYKDDHGNNKRTTFIDVEWSIANGDPLDKPKGLNYIEDPIAKARFGLDGGKKNRVGFYDNGEIHEPEYLLSKTCQELLQNNEPKITYEVNVLDLYRILGYEHERVNVGDEVVIIDNEFRIPLRVHAQVIEIKKDLLNPSNTLITLGNFKDNFTDDFDRLKQLENKLDENQGIWDDKLDGGNKTHFCEFGTLPYTGSTDMVFAYNFSQVYIDMPIIQASIQLRDEDINTVSHENISTSVQPITNPNGHYIGGRVKVHRSEATQREFFITIQAMCSSPTSL